MQSSVLDNITLNEHSTRDRLIQTLMVCELVHDLSTWPSGINTEIGENGTTLSGGQRKRIHLGRSIHHEKDIYMMDCPLAALDTRVA
jgi:ABC-type bacteriocin/lantibiotic exporter with double-glycine peptidase domain